MSTVPGVFAASCMVVLSLICGNVRASEQVSATSKNAAASGTVEGTVVYEQDPARLWRYARYYVKNRNRGQLAEAVVALTGLTRKKSDPPASSATVVMDQKNFQFAPETVAIRAGDRVRFRNSDNEVHNVRTVRSGHSFNVSLPAGDQHLESFRHAGNLRRPYRIGCVYHSAMRAWIFVFDHPHFHVTKADGRFRLKDVPAGDYRLEMIHPAGQLRWRQKIRVEADKTTTMEIRVSPDNLPKKRSK